ncbi:XRI1-like protein, partial [Drosera capensis]
MENGGGNSDCIRESWEWQQSHYCLQKDSNLGTYESMWGARDAQNLPMTTPIKDCGDFHYHVNASGNMKKVEGSKEASSQFKRRRMLQFSDEVLEPSFQSEDVLSTFLKSKESIDTVEDLLLDAPEWESGFQEDISLSCFEGLGEAESWLADCFNDNEFLANSEPHASVDTSELSSSGISDSQNDRIEDHSAQSTSHVILVQPRAKGTSGSIIIKGKRNGLKAPRKPTSSVAYPFTIIKPCSENGRLTLRDINQKIQAPPPRPKQEDPLSTYPTSAFSGKPVVGKTRIRTLGGKGSITIMRTK